MLSLISLPPLLNADHDDRHAHPVRDGARRAAAGARRRSVNAGGTPTVATLVTTAVAVVLIATGTFQKLVAVASFFLAVNYFVCCLALIVLRRREPDAVRPFRAWGYPWSAGDRGAGAAAFLVGALVADTPNALLALVLLAAGLAGRLTSHARQER